MSYNGSGVFNINTAGQPVVTGTVISSSVFNALTADLATGLSTAITKDGQTTVTANIGFNGYKITNLGAGTAATDAARVGQLQAGAATVITVTGTDTYTGTMAPALAGYAAGNMFSFIVPNTNTSSCTLNIDGQGAKSITRDGSTALVAGDLVSGSEVVVIYDGTRFQVLNSNSKTNFNLSGTLTVAGNVTLSGGTANGVVYLNGSKVATTGSALTFDGTTFGVNPNVANSTSLLVTGAYTGSGTATMLAFQRAGGAVAGAIRYNDSAGDIEFGTTTSHPLAFIYGGSEQMRLNSTGLGIGTSSPLVKFQVKDGTNYNFWVRQNSSTLQLAAATDAAVLTVPMAFSAGSYSWAVNNGTNALNLDSSGNLGLGVTPSAWWPSRRVLQFDTAASITSFIGSSGVELRCNAYLNGSAQEIYQTSSQATLYGMSGGEHRWYNAPSGTAGNAISFTQAMTLDASGNLAIGTTSATGRLSVVGDYALFRENASGADVYIRGYYGSANVAAIQVSTNSPLAFVTNNTERARIDSSGNLLVGTTNAAENAGSGMKVINTGGTVALVSTASDSSQQGFEMYSTTAGAYRLYINYAGTINATNTTISAISDQRLKENIQDIDVGLDAIMSLKPRKFDWKAGKGKDIKNDRGWIAQEFEQVFPDLVDEWKDPAPEGEEPYKSVRADLIPVLVKAIQELTARVAQLESK